MSGFRGNISGLSLTEQTLEMMKASLGDPTDRMGNKLAKGVTISTGLTWYDLEAPAKNLYPTITPLRNSIPRVRHRFPGNAAHWKQVSSIIGSGYDSMGWVPEGQRSGTMSYVTANLTGTYVTMGEEDFLTFEAEAAAEGFEDENAMVTFRLLQKMMRKEEIGILGGNKSILLGTPATPTGTGNTGSGGSLGAATYNVYVVALTLEGYKNSSLANGIATSQVITGADGKNFTLSGGSSALSAASANIVVGAGNSLITVVAPVNGAVAYGWFVGVNGSGVFTLQAITTRASMTLSTAIVGGRQAQTAVTADNSRNLNLAYDGLLACAFNPNNPFGDTSFASGAYINYVANTTNGIGLGLTASGRGSVVEIDDMLLSMWNNFNISPTVIYVNAQEQKNITTAVLTNVSGPLLRYEVPTTPGQSYGITASGVVEFYYNPFSVDGGTKIPIKLHPDVPPGTILAWCEKLPPWYQSNEIPNVAEMLIRRDYYRIDWPLRTREREYGVYAEEVLAVYATFGMGVITNLANRVN